MPLWARLFGFCSRDPAADLWFRALALGAHGAEHGHVGELAILAERASSSQVLRAQRSWGRTPGALGLGLRLGLPLSISAGWRWVTEKIACARCTAFPPIFSVRVPSQFGDRARRGWGWGWGCF